MTQLRHLSGCLRISTLSPRDPGRRLRSALIALLLAGAAIPAWPGGLTVNGASAYEGSYGLQVDTTSICASAQDVTLTGQTISGILDEQACDSITAGTGFVVSSTGDVSFSAGRIVVLGSGFAVEQGGAFVAGLDPALSGSAYVQDDSPASEVSYEAQFYVNAGSLALGASDRLEHFVAYGPTGDSHIRILIVNGPDVLLEVVDSGGTVHQSAAIPLGAGWSKVALHWSAATAAIISLTVNDSTTEQITADTSSRRVDTVRWGSVDGTMAGISGQMSLDGFYSTR